MKLFSKSLNFEILLSILVFSTTLNGNSQDDGFYRIEGREATRLAIPLLEKWEVFRDLRANPSRFGDFESKSIEFSKEKSKCGVMLLIASKDLEATTDRNSRIEHISSSFLSGIEGISSKFSVRSMRTAKITERSFCETIFYFCGDRGGISEGNLWVTEVENGFVIVFGMFPVENASRDSKAVRSSFVENLKIETDK